MQVESREARRLVDLLNGWPIVVRLRRGSASTWHSATGSAALRVDLSPVQLLAVVFGRWGNWVHKHDRVGNPLEVLLLGFVSFKQLA